MKIELVDSTPHHPDALSLLDELSAELRAITGSDGTARFRTGDLDHPRSVFLLARQDGRAVGCGALRPLEAAGDPHVAEIKRMYARERGRGIGAAVLAALEARAHSFGYREIWLETRKVNLKAVGFYQRLGYRVRENYGPYVGRTEAVCFEKALPGA
ncbi:GNAT family N-acetyltransferase [Caldimonas brevitalea]|uniref:Histone acetyltransferase HPA2 n=1 Tax=Caldimonas brevitalea TaxID=413882 RepID=A0A0G3BUB5_9BURK|nr:GNAT family N-acetyltransferase [Caldimonas brevitalea]AKJ30956.1 histone acetyltransferase HPA2 [Caldimonas brevitalea]